MVDTTKFFTKETDPADFAKAMRRFAMEAIRMYIEHDDSKSYINKEWISDGHYWLHQLCETIDPQLEDPQAAEKK